MLSTHNKGGVAVKPSELAAMQAGDYILHARDGELQKVAVEKIRFPRDPQGHPQRLNMVQAPNGTIYAAQHTLIHKSTDGGRTWEHLHRDPARFGGWRLLFDDEGTMLNICQSGADAFAVWASRNEGETWERVGVISVETPAKPAVGSSVTRLADGTLLIPVQSSNIVRDQNDMVVSGTRICHVYRSTDGGRSWSWCSTIGECSCEVNVSALPGGRLLAVNRYQRPRRPEDSPQLYERMGAPPGLPPGNGPYKHVFLSHSDDKGATWTPLRQLTTVFGQCYGFGVGLADGSAVVVHDHRYPRDMAGGRAMVSRDEGETWEDAVYYLNHGNAAGYAATLSLDGQEMLTFVGSCYGGVERWENCVGRTDFVLLRWRLV